MQFLAENPAVVVASLMLLRAVAALWFDRAKNAMALDKDPNYWIAVAGSLLYLASRRAPEESARVYLSKMASAGFMAIGISEPLSTYFTIDESITAVVVVIFSQVVFDVIHAILADRKLLLEIIKRRLGGGNGKE